MNRFLLAPLLLNSLLSGCGQPQNQAAPLTLTAVRPNPAQPGEQLTIVGTLPPNAALQLDGQDVASVPIIGGAQLDLPESAGAGLHIVRVKGTELAGATQVIPRLDAVTVNGSQLRVRGAGWLGSGALLPATSVLVNGQVLPAQADGRDLTVGLGGALTYGSLSVQVSVGQSVSAPFTTLRQAAAVSGSVRLPGMTTAPLRSQATPRPARAVQDPAALIVHHSAATFHAPAFSGLLAQDTLPTLHLTRLQFGTAAQAALALAWVRIQPDVLSVTPDLLMHTDGLSALALPRGLGQQWFWPLEGLPEAWRKTQGQGVVVAVVDTGILLHHPDLQANLLPGHDFVDDGLPDDRVGHGTHVAGLIAAQGAVTGAAPQAQLLPVRVLDAARGGSAFTVAQGVLWAANLLPGIPNPHPAQIINLSLGTTEDSPALREAVAQVVAQGVLVVAATGNSGGSLNYPAAYPGVLAVTAVAGPRLMYQPAYASKGPGTGLAAYGGDSTADQDADGMEDGILSTDLVNGQPGYSLRMGTSMAAPQVAGVAALALAAGVAPTVLRQSLLASATDLGVLGEDEKFGRGLVSAQVARPLTPRTYVLALDEQEQVRAWTPVADDGGFVLSNLDPALSVHLRAVGDANGNRILGEAGELLSEPTSPLVLTPGALLKLPVLSLSPSPGLPTYSLEP